MDKLLRAIAGATALSLAGAGAQAALVMESARSADAASAFNRGLDWSAGASRFSYGLGGAAPALLGIGRFDDAMSRPDLMSLDLAAGPQFQESLVLADAKILVGPELASDSKPRQYWDQVSAEDAGAIENPLPGGLVLFGTALAAAAGGRLRRRAGR